MKPIIPFKERTHCPHGHAYTEANTIKLKFIRRDGAESFKRQCRACKRASHRVKLKCEAAE